MTGRHDEGRIQYLDNLVSYVLPQYPGITTAAINKCSLLVFSLLRFCCQHWHGTLSQIIIYLVIPSLKQTVKHGTHKAFCHKTGNTVTTGLNLLHWQKARKNARKPPNCYPRSPHSSEYFVVLKTIHSWYCSGACGTICMKLFCYKRPKYMSMSRKNALKRTNWIK